MPPSYPRYTHNYFSIKISVGAILCKKFNDSSLYRTREIKQLSESDLKGGNQELLQCCNAATMHVANCVFVYHMQKALRAVVYKGDSVAGGTL